MSGAFIFYFLVEFCGITGTSNQTCYGMLQTLLQNSWHLDQRFLCIHFSGGSPAFHLVHSEKQAILKPSYQLGSEAIAATIPVAFRNFYLMATYFEYQNRKRLRSFLRFDR